MADEQANTDLAIADRTVALPAPSSHLDSTSTLNSGASNSSMITMETARRLMLAASVLIGVLLVFLLVMWIQQPQYSPLG